MDRQQLVMVVEDDEEIRGAIDLFLEDDGYVVASAASLRDARRILGTVIPDFLLLDLHLAFGEVGTDLLDDCAAAGIAPKALLVSASPEAAAAARRFGIDVVRKPFDLVDLVRRMQEAGTPKERATPPS
jgi:two-component system, OmpR family, phosphate regulon response regulator OmpR